MKSESYSRSLKYCVLLSLDGWDGNKKSLNNIGDSDDFQKDSCILTFKDSNKNYQSNQYNFKKESGAACTTGTGGTYLGQSFICQKSLGNINLVKAHNDLSTPYILQFMVLENTNLVIQDWA